MSTEMVMIATVAATAGTCAGYIFKHIQDTKYLKAQEREAVLAVGTEVKKACKKMAKHDRALMENMLRKIDSLEKENAYLRHPEFFEVPNKIKTDSKLFFEDRT